MYSIISWCDSGLIIENRGSLVYKGIGGGGGEGGQHTYSVCTRNSLLRQLTCIRNMVEGSVMGLFGGT